MKKVWCVLVIAFLGACLCAAGVASSASNTVINVTPATESTVVADSMNSTVAQPTEITVPDVPEIPEEPIEWAYTDGSVYVCDERIAAINGNYNILPDDIWLDPGTYTVTLIDGTTDHIVVYDTYWSCDSLVG